MIQTTVSPSREKPEKPAQNSGFACKLQSLTAMNNLPQRTLIPDQPFFGMLRAD